MVYKACSVLAKHPYPTLLTHHDIAILKMEIHMRPEF